MISKILENIINHPSETEIYGKLNFSRIYKKLTSCQPAFDLLFIAGFCATFDGKERLIWQNTAENIVRLTLIYQILSLNHQQRQSFISLINWGHSIAQALDKVLVKEKMESCGDRLKLLIEGVVCNAIQQKFNSIVSSNKICQMFGKNESIQKIMNQILKPGHLECKFLDNDKLYISLTKANFVKEQLNGLKMKFECSTDIEVGDVKMKCTLTIHGVDDEFSATINQFEILWKKFEEDMIQEIDKRIDLDVDDTCYTCCVSITPQDKHIVIRVDVGLHC